MINVCIIGASGRMGRNIAKLVFEDKETNLSGAVDRFESSIYGKPIYEAAGISKGGVVVSDDIMAGLQCSDVVIDFTAAKATVANITYYKKAGIPLVIGSTGFDSKEKKTWNLLLPKYPYYLLLI